MAELSAFSPDGINSYNYKDAAARNMITPVFDSATIYAVGDYCIYNNGLYKCTTAHTGAWSANDFTAVSVMNEIKNASGGGGGGLPETTKFVYFDRQVDDFTQETIEKSVTFPILGDSGHGEFSVSGVAQYGNSSSKMSFIGSSPMYKMYNTPYSKYQLVDYTPSQSGSYPNVTPCFGGSSGSNYFCAIYNNRVYLKILLDWENLGVVNLTLYTADFGSYKLNRVSAMINAVFA